MMDWIDKLATELANGDKFLREELRSEMNIAYNEHKDTCEDIDKQIQWIAGARAQGYLSGRQAKKGRSDIRARDKKIAELEHEIRENNLDTLARLTKDHIFHVDHLAKQAEIKVMVGKLVQRNSELELELLKRSVDNETEDE